MSSIFASPRFLSRVMWVDAASCAATGGLQLGLTDTLARLTGLPAGLLVGTGAFLLVYAVAAAAMAMRSQAPRGLIGLVAAGNFGWAAACAALLVTGLLPITPLGMIWVVVQAATVLVLAEAQWLGLRATRPAGRTAMASQMG